MLKLSPPGSENAIIDNYVPIFRPGEYKTCEEKSTSGVYIFNI
jgi:hypothetical protein